MALTKNWLISAGITSVICYSSTFIVISWSSRIFEHESIDITEGMRKLLEGNLNTNTSRKGTYNAMAKKAKPTKKNKQNTAQNLD